jgi:glutathione S-transferase
MRMRGALGPFQSTGMEGAMNVTFTPKNGGTELEISYNLGGLCERRASMSSPSARRAQSQFFRLKYSSKPGPRIRRAPLRRKSHESEDPRVPAEPTRLQVLSFANHIGIPYEFVLVDLTKGRSARPNSPRSISTSACRCWKRTDSACGNPTPSSSILRPRSRSSACCRKDERARADVSRWGFWESAHWDSSCATLVFERFVKGVFGGGAADPKEVERGLTNFNRAAKVLDTHLKGRKYLCSDHLTVADFSVGAALIMTEKAQFPLEPYGEIRAGTRVLRHFRRGRRPSPMRLRCRLRPNRGFVKRDCRRRLLDAEAFAAEASGLRRWRNRRAIRRPPGCA